jgi:hypothetical protein
MSTLPSSYHMSYMCSSHHPGWCYVKWVHGSTPGPSGDDRYLMPQIVGYEIWLYLTFVVLPVLYIWIRCYIRVKVGTVLFKNFHLEVGWKIRSIFFVWSLKFSAGKKLVMYNNFTQCHLLFLHLCSMHLTGSAICITFKPP